MVVMCEFKTRLWCCRIGVLFFVFSVLMIMIVQIWNYYFSLVAEMDIMLEKSPQLAAIWEICDHQLGMEWNIECTLLPTKWLCHLPSPKTYIDYRPVSENVTVGHNISAVWISPPDACVQMMVWVLPW